jgi:tocopherol cyclase
VYFVCNPALAAADPVFGGEGAKPSYGLLKVGCWGSDARQLHNYFGMQAVEIADGALSVRMGQNQLSETALSGSVAVSAADAAANPQWASDAGTLRWQLRADKQIAYSVGYGASARPGR